MPITNKNIKLTYADYLLYPANGKQLQLIEGEFIMSPAPKTYHQAISRNLLVILHSYVTQYKLGEVYDAPTDVVFSDADVTQPDILFVSKERLKIITKDNIKGAPDLVIEILSEKTRKLDVEVKRRLYARHGVKEYWIVDPDKKTVDVLTLSRSGYIRYGLYKKGHTLASPILPGLNIKVLEIFKK